MRCHHEMRFKMFTKHEVEIFVLHINVFNLNEFFLSICMQHTDKNVPRKWVFWGHIFDTLYCRIARASRGFATWTPTRALPWTHWGLTAPPRPPAAPGNDLQVCSLHIVPLADTTFIYALMTNLAHHSKFLKKRPGTTIL